MAAQFSQQPETPGGTEVLGMSLVLLVWILKLNGTRGPAALGACGGVGLRVWGSQTSRD